MPKFDAPDVPTADRKSVSLGDIEAALVKHMADFVEQPESFDSTQAVAAIWSALPDAPPDSGSEELRAALTGDDIRLAIAAATSLTNPRLSGVEWDDVTRALAFRLGVR